MSTPVLHSLAMCVEAAAHVAVAGWDRTARPIGQKNAEMNGPYHSDGLRVKSEPAI